MSTTSPLIVTFKQIVIAVDPETGAERWRKSVPTPVTRLFRVEGRLFVVYAGTGRDDARVACLDYDTGNLVGTVELDFAVGAGFVRGQRLYVGGRLGVACVTTAGQVLWKARSSFPSLGRIRFGEKETLHATSAAGEALWSADLVDPEGDEIVHNVGLLLDDSVAQPDL